MSTTINVTVDDGGLPARNKQQVAVNRQAYVQTRAAGQSAEQGEVERRLNRLGRGLDPTTGEPLIPPVTTSTLSRFAGAGIPRLDQRPAANRKETIRDGWFAPFTGPAELYQRSAPLPVIQRQQSEYVGFFTADKETNRYYAVSLPYSFFPDNQRIAPTLIQSARLPNQTSGLLYNRNISSSVQAFPTGFYNYLVLAKGQPPYSTTYIDNIIGPVSTQGHIVKYQNYTYKPLSRSLQSFDLKYYSNFGGPEGNNTLDSFCSLTTEIILINPQTNFMKYRIVASFISTFFDFLVVPYVRPQVFLDGSGDMVTVAVFEYRDGVKTLQLESDSSSIQNFYYEVQRTPTLQMFPKNHTWASYVFSMSKSGSISIKRSGVELLSTVVPIAIKPGIYNAVIDFEHTNENWDTNILVLPYFGIGDINFTYR